MIYLSTQNSMFTNDSFIFFLEKDCLVLLLLLLLYY